MRRTLSLFRDMGDKVILVLLFGNEIILVSQSPKESSEPSEPHSIRIVGEERAVTGENREAPASRQIQESMKLSEPLDLRIFSNKRAGVLKNRS